VIKIEVFVLLCQSTQKKKIYLPHVVAFTLNNSNIKSINDHGFLLAK
jgi:hypothetical protein